MVRKSLLGFPGDLAVIENPPADAGVKGSIPMWYWRRPLDYKEIKPVNLEYSLEGLMLKLKLPILWPLDSKSLFIRKDPDVGKD